jgi:hypothetical protein
MVKDPSGLARTSRRKAELSGLVTTMLAFAGARPTIVALGVCAWTADERHSPTATEIAVRRAVLVICSMKSPDLTDVVMSSGEMEGALGGGRFLFLAKAEG